MEDIRTLVGRFAKASVGTRNVQRATALGSLAVAQTELPRTEVGRAGRYFYGGNQVIANGIAPVTAIPTTAISAGLYNASQNGDSLVIDYIAGPWVGSGTPTAGCTLLCGISTAKAAGTIPTANMTGWASRNAQGGTGRVQASSALWDATATFVAAQTVWFSVGSNMQLAAATVGQGSPAIVLHGAIVVPPGYEVGFAILSGTGTTPLYGLSVGWAELPLDLE